MMRKNYWVLILAFVLMYPAIGIVSTLNFFSPEFYYSTEYIRYSQLAKVYQDDQYDLITTNDDLTELSVFSISSEGKIAKEWDTDVAPEKIQAIDLDGDGYEGFVGFIDRDFVLFRNIEGVIQPPVFLEVSSTESIEYFIIADVDQINGPDLVAITNTWGFGGAIHIFINNGLGSFSVSETIVNTNVLGDIKSIDLDGINGIDLVATDSNNLYMYLNDGSGGFSNSSSIEVISGYSSSVLKLKKMQINDDVFDDLVILSTNNKIALNNGDGTVSIEDAPTQLGWNSQVLADLDGEYGLDYIFESGKGIAIQLKENFGILSDEKLIINFDQFIPDDQIYLKDFDNQNGLDIVVATSDRLVVILNDGSGKVLRLNNYWGSFIFLHSIDFNEDGFLDIVTGGGSNLWVLENDGLGNFSGVEDINHSLDLSQKSWLVNVDNEAPIDVIFHKQLTIQSYETEVSLNFLNPNIFQEMGVLPRTYPIDGFDFDKDGNLDLVLSYVHNDQTEVFFGNGSGFDSSFQINENLNVQGGEVILDFNGDGYEDIIFSEYLNGQIFFENNTNQEFLPEASTGINYYSGNKIFCQLKEETEQEFIFLNSTHLITWGEANPGEYQLLQTLDPTASIRQVVCADIDGVNGNDIVFSGTSSGPVQAYLNDGYGNFDTNTEPVVLIEDGVYRFSIADVDGVNGLDIVAHYNIYLNDGAGEFNQSEDYNLQDFVMPIAWDTPIKLQDLNGDGSPDILFQSGVTGLKSGVLWNKTELTSHDYNFRNHDNVKVGSLRRSGSITIGPSEEPLSISIDNGTYSINGNAFTNTSGVVKEWDSLVVMHRATEEYDSDTETIVSIGSYDVSFLSHTEKDSYPKPVKFLTVENAFLGKTIYSNEVLLTDFDIPIPISISGGQYSINDSDFSSKTGEVRTGDRLVLKTIASEQYGGKAIVTVLIGTQEYEFKVISTKAGKSYQSWIDFNQEEPSLGNMGFFYCLITFIFCLFRKIQVKSFLFSFLVFPCGLLNAGTVHYGVSLNLHENNYDFSNSDFSDLGLFNKSSPPQSKSTSIDDSNSKLDFSVFIGREYLTLGYSRNQFDTFSVEHIQNDTLNLEQIDVNGSIDTEEFGISYKHVLNSRWFLEPSFGIYVWESKIHGSIISNGTMVSTTRLEERGKDLFFELAGGYSALPYLDTSFFVKSYFDVKSEAFGNSSDALSSIGLRVKYNNSFNYEIEEPKDGEALSGLYFKLGILPISISEVSDSLGVGLGLTHAISEKYLVGLEFLHSYGMEIDSGFSDVSVNFRYLNLFSKIALSKPDGPYFKIGIAHESLKGGGVTSSDSGLNYAFIFPMDRFEFEIAQLEADISFIGLNVYF